MTAVLETPRTRDAVRDAAIGVLGAGGTVGRTAASTLAAGGPALLRLGSRTPPEPGAVAAGPGTDVRSVAADAGDPDALAAFCSGLDLVVNCAGPAHRIGDRVLRAAAAAGADYVDVAGDEVAPAGADGPLPRRAVIAAGTMPGLTGVLPRALVAAGRPADPVAMTAWIGGLDVFTPAAAADYVAEIAAGPADPRTGAAVRDGVRRTGVLRGRDDVAVPHFPERAAVQPYLSAETERTAAELGLADVDWFHAFAASRSLHALRRLAATAGERGPEAAAEELRAAAAADTAGRRRYQLFVVELRDAAGAGTTVVVRTGDGYALCGELTALAAGDVLAGVTPDGVHALPAALDPVTALDRVAALPAVEHLAVLDSGAGDTDETEEGAL